MKSKSTFCKPIAWLLTLAMIISMLPVSVFATEDIEMDISETSTEAVCDCGTDDAAIHATNCAVYVAPEKPECKCVEKCTEPNLWCDICGFDVTACEGGTDAAAAYAEGDVASVTTADGQTTTNHATIDEAISTAMKNSGSTLTLLDNIPTDSTVIIDSGSFTIDLGSNTWEFSSGNLIIRGDADITITGSTDGAGKLSGTDYRTINLIDSATLEITGGTVENAASWFVVDMSYDGDPTNAQLIVSGGKLITEYLTAIEANGCLVKVTGGAIESNERNVDYKTGAIDLSDHNDPTGITIHNSTGAEVTPSENTIKLPTDYVMQDNYGNVAESLEVDKTYTVGEDPGPVASVTTVGNEISNHANINAAITEAKQNSGSTLKLLNNITMGTYVTIDEGSFTIDLNGKTWESSGNVLRIEGASNITITDSSAEQTGMLLGTDSSNPTILLYAKLEIARGTVKNAGTQAVYVDDQGDPTNAQLIVSGGKVSTTGTIAISAFGSLVKVTGGTIESTSVNIAYGAGAIDLSGHSDPTGITILDSINGVVNLGESTIKLPADYVMLDESGKAVESLMATKIYTVGKAPTASDPDSVASVTTEGGEPSYHTNITSAINAAKQRSGSTLTLLDAISMDSTVAIDSGSFTIDLNGKMWQSSGDVLRINGTDTNITITDSMNGGTLETGDTHAIVMNGGSVKINGGTITGWIQYVDGAGELDLSGHNDPAGIELYTTYAYGSASEKPAIRLPAGYVLHDTINNKYVNEPDKPEWNSDYKVVKDPNAPTTYTVTVTAGEGGTVTADPTTAAEGDTVTLAVNPAESYAIDTVFYNDGTNDIEITPVDGVYSFTMPASDVTVSATFEETAETYDLWVGGEQFTSKKLTITDDTGGTAKYDPESNTLTLTNYNFTGDGYDLYNEEEYAAIYYGGTEKLNLVLEGDSTVTQQSAAELDDSYGIYSKGGITVSGDGSLTATGGTANNSSGVLTQGGIAIADNASLTGKGSAANYNSFGVCAAGSVKVEGGSMSGIVGMATDASGSSYGVLIYDSITVSDGGSMSGTGGEANTDSTGVYAVNSINVIDGSLTAKGGNADNSYGVSGNTIIKGGETIAKGNTAAFNKAPTIADTFTNAVVWYGESEEAANTAGAKLISELANNYNQKYVKVAEKPSSYTVTFDAGEGTGTKEPVTDISGEYTLPWITATNFAAPDDKEFKGWEINGTIYAENAKINVTSNITAKAIWVIPTSIQLQSIDFYSSKAVGYQLDQKITRYWKNGDSSQFTGTPDDYNAKIEWSVRDGRDVATITFKGANTADTDNTNYGLTVSAANTFDVDIVVEEDSVMDQFTLYSCDVSISGDGKLTIVDPKVDVQNIYVDGNLTLSGANIYAESLEKNAANIIFATGNLVIDNSAVEIRSGSDWTEEYNFAPLRSNGTMTISNGSDVNVTCIDGTTCHAVMSLDDITIEDSTVTVTNNGTNRGISSEKNIYIKQTANDTTNVTVNSNGIAIAARNGKLTISGGTVNATSATTYATLRADEIVISGGNVTANAVETYGIYAEDGDITISGNADVLASSTTNTAICAEGNINISGNADVLASSTTNTAICAVGNINISENANVVASGGVWALWSKANNIAISGGTVEAKGSAYAIVSKPVLTGYTNPVVFAGADESNAEIIVDTANTSYHNMKYVKVQAGYIVTFADYDGRKIDIQAVEHGSAAAAPENPVREGYIFICWDKAFDNVTSNLTVTAQYEEEKETVSITESAQTFTYNNTEKAFDISGTSLTGFTVEYYVEDAWTTAAPKNAGIYNVRITRDEDDTYKAFDKTLEDALIIERKTIDNAIVLTAPIKNSAPQTEITGDGYTATVVWSPAVTDKFGYNTEYTATITITADENHTVTGIAANGYTVEGAKAVNNDENSNVITVAYEKTGSRPSSGGGGYSNTTTTTTKNEDGSTTKVTENKTTGTKTEVTTNTDGSTTTVETKKDGTVTTTEKDKDGNTTTTVEKSDGTSTTTEKNKDGSEKVTENKADGTTVTTEKDTEGTKTVTTEKADGSTTTEETKKDGTKVTTETNADGETKTEIDLPKDKETEVTIPAHGAEDVTSITVTDKDGKETEITDFEITENGVKVTVSGDCTAFINKAAKKEFADVHPVNHWATADVDYAYIKGLMMGTSENHFSPDVPLTRAMLVTVLYRLEGEPATNRSIPFADVDMGAYYGNAVSWAKQNGIVNGVTENEFAPNDNITREQIAAIMHRYAQYKGYDVSVGENTNILSYDDFDSISEYAIASMQYACGSGLMKGKTTSTLNPLDNATRAEIAAILHRFIEANK